MPDQVIDAAMAQALQVDVARTHALSGWVVMRDPPDYPDKVVARLTTDAPTLYVLVADTLGGLHATLPPGLVRSSRRPAQPPEVIEIWLAA
jgi:hypothetical protein